MALIADPSGRRSALLRDISAPLNRLGHFGPPLLYRLVLLLRTPAGWLPWPFAVALLMYCLMSLLSINTYNLTGRVYLVLATIYYFLLLDINKWLYWKLVYTNSNYMRKIELSVKQILN